MDPSPMRHAHTRQVPISRSPLHVNIAKNAHLSSGITIGRGPLENFERDNMDGNEMYGPSKHIELMSALANKISIRNINFVTYNEEPRKSQISDLHANESELTYLK